MILDLEYQVSAQEPGEARPEVRMWTAALVSYVNDVKAYHRWLVWPNSPAASDKGQAFRDFKSDDFVLLKNLCLYLDYDAAGVRNAIKNQLAELCEGGLQ